METLKILRIVRTVVHFFGGLSPVWRTVVERLKQSGSGDSPRGPVSRGGSVKKTKIATSEKTPVHKSAANGTGTLAQKTRFRQGEQPTLLSRILPLLRNRKIKTEIRQFYWAFVCKFFGKKRVLCVLPYLLQIGDFFRTASFVFGRLQFFSRTMPLSCEPLLPIYVTRGGGERIDRSEFIAL